MVIGWGERRAPALGIDFGTSGARAIAINAAGSILFEYRISFGQTSSQTIQWQDVLFELLTHLPRTLAPSLQAIAINGTSGTVLLCDRAGRPQVEPLLYNDDRGRAMLEQLRAIAPERHPVISATSSFAKLLWWQRELHWRSPPVNWTLLHQADWLAFLLHGQLGVSDYHNALKLGYDPGALAYPDWLLQTELAPLFPRVVAPGTVIGSVTEAIAQRFQINPHCVVCAGTTDSIAAFLASGVEQPGEAVTSLGSTLVLKLLSETRVDDATFGIYSHRLDSHRLGSRWLVGGASNTGGAVLRQFFGDEALRRLSGRIDPGARSPLDYYPLLQPGERFPFADPQLQPRLTPRPADEVQFLHGLLESMARIEAQGYGRLQDLGATPLRRVRTAGGGAQNQAWTAIRQRVLGVPVETAPQLEAAYGTARLASQSAIGNLKQ